MIDTTRPGPRALAAAAVLGVLTLGACADEPEPAGPTASPTSSAPTGSPSTSPTAAAPTPTETSPSDPGPAGDERLSIAFPRDGATVRGPEVTVEGEGTAFEGTLLWRVTDPAGTTVAEDFTMAGANGEVGPYSFTVTLDPGTYSLEVWEQDMSDGEAPDPPPHVQIEFTVE